MICVKPKIFAKAVEDNLIEVARRTVNGKTRPAWIDLLEAGEPKEVIEAAKSREENAGEEDLFSVLKDNVPAYQLYQAMQTQWDRAGLNGAKSGLKYDRIDSVLEGKPELLTEQPYPVLFNKLQTLELATLAAINEKK